MSNQTILEPDFLGWYSILSMVVVGLEVAVLVTLGILSLL